MNFIKLILFVFVLNISLLANANLYVYVFKDGTPVKDVTIKAAEFETKTNEYGYAYFNLKNDTYEISYLKDGKLFALQDVNVVDDQDSQLFLNLIGESQRLDLDLPLDAYNQDFKKVKVKKLSGPKGTLSFKLIDAKSKKVISNAKLYFKGYQIEGKSDKKGNVKLDIPEGKYDISIVHPNYVMKVLEKIEVKFKETTAQEISMTQSNITLEEYVILAPAVEGSLASTFAALKENASIGDLVGSEQFSKQGDSSVSSALKRISGVTIVDGKYVYVRGLGERYSTVLLNGLNVPSPNPLKRVVPLDIFPTSITQNLLVQKTYSPNLPGNFGGGAVDISTKGIPKEDNFVQGSIGLTYNAATGTKGYYNSQNNIGIPANVLAATDNFNNFGMSDLYNEDDKKEYAKLLAQYRNYNLAQKRIEPGKSVSLSAGQSFKTSGDLKYGFAGNIYYKTDGDITDFTKTYYSVSNDGNLTIPGNTGDYSNTELTEKLGGLLSFELDNQDGQKVKFTTLMLDQRNDSTTYADKLNSANDTYLKETIYTYTEENLKLNQLTGTNTIFLGKTTEKLLDDIIIDWGMEKGTATNIQPGTVAYKYQYKGDTDDTDPPYPNSEYEIYTPNPVVFTMSDLEDKLDDKKISLKLPFEYNNQDNYIEFGISRLHKERVLDSRTYELRLANSSKCSSSSTQVEEDSSCTALMAAFGLCKVLYNTTPSCYEGDDTNQTLDEFFQTYSDNGVFSSGTPFKDSAYYEAQQDIKASYFRTKFSPLEELDLIIGQRFEKSIQQMTTKGRNGDNPVNTKTYQLVTNDKLPEVSAVYRINEDMQIKGGYSKSISRPDFREFVSNEYTDPITGEKTVGFDGLKYTTITNKDLMFEHYLSYDEKYTIAFFTKEFENPIETVSLGDSDGNIMYTLRNAKEAKSEGFEIGFRKKLSFIDDSLSNYFISGNYAKIKSTISLDQNSSDAVINDLRTKSRPMQGQSPYVINLSLGYDNIHTGRSAIFTYNEYGERLVSLGLNGENTYDWYEQPFKKLDFVLKYKINDTYDISEKKIGYTLKFKISNLLDSEKKIMQGNSVVKSYKPGKSYNLSFSMKY